VNPDGYVYNQMVAPTGGGMWRKNRRDNGNHFGVDLNRNYAYKWGFDNTGSSTYMGSNTYRGAFAFSEPETRAIRDLCIDHQFRTALSYHAHGEYLIHPWGYNPSALNPDAARYKEIGEFTTEHNHYRVGDPRHTVGYIANGVSDDWMYGEQQVKNKIFSFSPEVGAWTDGFWPAQNRIGLLCEEQVTQNLRIACLAGECVVPEPEMPCEVSATSVPIPIRYKNYGFENSGAVSGQFQSNHPAVAAISVGTVNVPNLLAGSEAQRQFEIQLHSNTARGTRIDGVIRSYLPGGIIHVDSIAFFYGEPDIVFRDSVDGTSMHWNGGWGMTTERAHSGQHSITDSPFAAYVPSDANRTTLATPIDLANYVHPMLKFNASWEMGLHFDYCQVMVSTDGSTYTPMEGQFTRPGMGFFQPDDVPLYEASQYTWIDEKIDLSAYAGQTIWLRFQLSSDQGESLDGFYFDDLTVTGYKNSVSTTPPEPEDVFVLAPNPAAGQVQVLGTPVLGEVILEMHAMVGQLAIRKVVVPGDVLDLEQLPAGVYVYRFLENGERGPAHRLVLR
ncbi:MAG: M14 family zinc carboxypeptidase, partial [Bacteroidota bacterium]